MFWQLGRRPKGPSKPTQPPIRGAMVVHRRSRLALVCIAGIVSGCITPTNGTTSPTWDITVPIDAALTAPRDAALPRRAVVRVTDIHREPRSERTSLGVSLGRITLSPPLPDLVAAVVESKADEVLARRNVTDAETVLCGIREFHVTTPSTPFYWDVQTKVQLVLRVHGEDRTVSGAATERTFLWPSQALIARVTTEALRQVAVETGRALDDLFANRP